MSSGSADEVSPDGVTGHHEGVVSTAADVAARARLSRAQVSNYFNNPQLVSSEAKERIGEAIEALGYVRNESARRLRVGSHQTVGLVVLDAWTPFFSEVAQAMEEGALRRGWQLHIANSARDAEREQRQLDYFEAQRVSGLVVVPQGDVVGRLERFAGQGAACVLVDPPADVVLPSTVGSVSVDHVHGGRLAGQHLLQRGCRRIGFVGDPQASRASAERFQGLQEACAGQVVTLYETPQLTLGAGTAAAAALLDQPAHARADGLLVGNDITAIGLMHALSVGGVAVPAAVAVVGYDGIALAAQLPVGLTSVEQPMAELAAEVMAMATREQALGQVVLTPRLQVRASA